MNYFATIESAHEYVTLLTETLQETRVEIESELATIEGTRRHDALSLARYKLEQLERLLTKGSKYLNDLRRLEKLCSE